MVSPKLSILICSLESRKPQLRQLLANLNSQQEALPEPSVEITVLQDSGKASIASKRNQLLQASNGLFTAFIDDDDEVATNYLSVVLNAIESNPEADVVELNGIIRFFAQKKEVRFCHSLKYDTFDSDKEGRYGPPNHLNPIRTSLARQVAFPERKRGEDTEWALELTRLNLMKKEAPSNTLLYFYNCNELK